MRYVLLLGVISLGLVGMTQACEDSAEYDAAKADLAQRLNVSLDSISVLDHVEKTWRDGSLGCPRPGMSYKQVLIPGSQLVLGVDGQRYYYHAGGHRDYFFCTQPGAAVDSSGVPESH